MLMDTISSLLNVRVKNLGRARQECPDVEHSLLTACRLTEALHDRASPPPVWGRTEEAWIAGHSDLVQNTAVISGQTAEVRAQGRFADIKTALMPAAEGVQRHHCCGVDHQLACPGRHMQFNQQDGHTRFIAPFVLWVVMPRSATQAYLTDMQFLPR